MNRTDRLPCLILELQRNRTTRAELLAAKAAAILKIHSAADITLSQHPSTLNS